VSRRCESARIRGLKAADLRNLLAPRLPATSERSGNNGFTFFCREMRQGGSISSSCRAALRPASSFSTCARHSQAASLLRHPGLAEASKKSGFV
jgi:hypothetical protein